MRFAKGHGTGNDFLILPDPEDELTLSPELVTRLCDRRTGLGADGILRAVRTAAVGAQSAPGRKQPMAGSAGGGPGPMAASAPEWFMDYRNANGSIAEMCGNGIRVFARYLLDYGLAAGPVIAVATRAGTKQVHVAANGEFTIDMGAARILGAGSAVVGGRTCEGLAIRVGNPHLACLVDAPVAEFDLSSPPVIDHRQFPDGANVEVLRVTGDSQIEMRVHERGSGITLSCGTGAVAAAVAAGAKAHGGAAGNGQVGPAGTWTVHIPGGRLVVTLTETTSLLTGPAVIVAEGDLVGTWL